MHTVVVVSNPARFMNVYPHQSVIYEISKIIHSFRINSEFKQFGGPSLWHNDI